VSWTPVDTGVTCDSSGVTLHKQHSFNGQADPQYAELRFTIGGQDLPSSYTVSFTVGSMVDPTWTPTASCSGVLVDTTADGLTFDAVSVCGDGSMSIVRVAEGKELGRTNNSIASGADPGTSGSFNVVVNVKPDSVVMSVDNLHGATAGITSTPVVNPTTAYISLAILWRNAGAQAEFSNFHYSAGA
jgi:hypothetical protein